MYYAADIAGSDIMRHPEAYSNQPGRHIPEGFYRNGTEAGTYGLLSYQKEGTSGTYGCLFSVIGRCNAITTAIEKTSEYQQMMQQTEPTELSQLYGEAVAIRATCYRELIKYFGDVQFQSTFGVVASGLASRDSIYDVCIDQLKKVEPLMYVLGKCPTYEASAKNYYSRTYVDGLIGRMALEAGGYQTRRNDIKRVDGQGNTLTFETIGTENNGSTYGRRSDWRNLYETAKTYFKKAIDNPGTAVFHDTDPRKTDGQGRVYGNPYQYFFQQLQLVVYMNAAMELADKNHPKKEIIPGGILYYHIDDPVLETEENISESEAEHALLMALRPDGLVNADETIYRGMDADFEGKSEVIPVELKKSGEISMARSHVATTDEFALIQRYVTAEIKRQGQQIYAGDVSVNPYQNGTECSCNYCPYASVCGIGGKIPGYGYRHMENLSKDDVFDHMETDLARQE